MSIVRSKFKEMLLVQDATNSFLAPKDIHWCETHYFNFNRAIWIEGAEFCDHLGWKWWSKQETNVEQAKIELIDMWHFIMSQLMMDNYYPDFGQISFTSVLDSIEESYKVSLQHSLDLSDLMTYPLVTRMEDFLKHVIAEDSFSENLLTPFFDICLRLELDLNSLYKYYISKNILNTFRQMHGYKEGKYIKMWNGVEDNKVLEKLISTLDLNSEDFSLELLNLLFVEYERICK
jgi:dUTPase